MKKVLAIKTPVGGIVQIIPREDSETAVGLSWRETILSEVEKEASRLYLFDEGFIEHAIGSPRTGHGDRTFFERDLRYEFSVSEGSSLCLFGSSRGPVLCQNRMPTSRLAKAPIRIETLIRLPLSAGRDFLTS